MEETITIPRKHYDNLLKAETFLECLDAEGVDNWEGYERAAQEYLKQYPTFGNGQ